MADFSAERPCRILSLDGGGAKGFYTLGVLREIEGMVKRPLHEQFDLIRDQHRRDHRGAGGAP